MKKVIQKILKEEVKVPLIIRRNVDFDVLNKEFNIALNVTSERFREMRHKLTAMTAEKFGTMVISTLMVEFCHRYENLCADDSGLFDDIWEFLNKFYSKQMTKRFYDIMYLDESIIRAKSRKNLRE